MSPHGIRGKSGVLPRGCPVNSIDGRCTLSMDISFLRLFSSIELEDGERVSEMRITISYSI